MKTIQLKIGGRTLALRFDLNAMVAMEETIPDFDIGKLSDYVRTPSGLLDMILILAREGEEAEGRTLDIDKKWLGRHLTPSPAKIAKVHVVVLDTLREGLNMETEDEDEGEVDVVLEEIKKKEEKDD